MNVLSLFDGISCGQLALQRAGIKVNNYFASEIDKYAIQITKKNFPKTIFLGDVNKYDEWDLPQIDLLIGGSPCQDLSVSKKDRQGLKGERSKLFYIYVECLKKYSPKYFLLENVASMPKEAKEEITKLLGVEPVLINSSLVSAQQRKRLYWTNINNISQPNDKHIYLKDILESELSYADKSQCLGTSYQQATFNDSLEKHRRTLIAEPVCVAQRGRYKENGQTEQRLEARPDGKTNTLTTVQKDNMVACPIKYCNDKNIAHILRPYGSKAHIITKEEEKSPTLLAAMGTGGGNGIYYAEKPLRIGQFGNGGQGQRVYSVRGKSVSLNANGGGWGAKTGLYKINLPDGDYYIRKLTPLECERLQTLPDRYTEGISNSQRYKCIGNGWTVDVIAHIFGCIGVNI